MLAVLLFSLGDQWMDPPQTRIFEAIICYRYYEDVDPSKILQDRSTIGPGAIGGVDEMWCKADTIQSELAALRGWQNLFDGLPTLLLAVPMGWAADKFGRKPIITLGLVALVLRALWIQSVTWFWQSFDVRWSWFSTVFGSLGGGSSVLTSLIFVSFSDITPESKRAGIFLRVGAFNLLAALLMPPFAALLMEVSPWIPNIGGTVLELLTLILYTFCPETLNYTHPSLPAGPNLAPPPPPPYESTPTFTDPDATGPAVIWHKTKNAIKSLIHSLSFLTHDWRILVLMVPFTIHMLVGIVGQLLLQYISKRYEVKLSKAILLTTIRMGVVVLLLFSILPYISTWLMQKFKLSAQRKDLYLARASMMIVAIGWTLVGLSPNLPLVVIALAISSMGYGAWLMLRSFLTSLLPKNQIAKVYSIMSIIDTLGIMFGAPFMAALFKHGLALGGFWVGMPFYFLGITAGCFSLVLFLIGLRKGEDEVVAADDENE